MFRWPGNEVVILVMMVWFAELTIGSPAQSMCSPAKERMRRALAFDRPHSRLRRTIEVPPGSGWQCKWAINLPFETQARYSAKIQFAIPIKVGVPPIFFDEHGFDHLKGIYIDEEEHHYEHPEPSYHAPEPHYGPPHHARSIRSLNYSTALINERVELYEHVEGLLGKLGLPARSCLLRTICEVADDPVESGLLGDFFNLFLTPSVATTPGVEHFGDLKEFLDAETHGHTRGQCHDAYYDCAASLFHVLPMVANHLFSS